MGESEKVDVDSEALKAEDYPLLKPLFISQFNIPRTSFRDIFIFRPGKVQGYS